MLDTIVNSKVKIKLLKTFSRRKGSMHVSEAARLAGVSKSSASQSLKELSESGVLESRAVGKSIEYSLASGILAQNVIKYFSVEGDFLTQVSDSAVTEIVKPKAVKPISIALFGSSLKGLKPKSDVDILVVSGKKQEFYKIGALLTEKFGVRVSILSMPLDEFRDKAKAGEEFVINVLANHKLIYGKGLEDLIWQGKSGKKRLKSS